MPREDDFHKRVTIGVITALPKEYAALEVVLETPNHGQRQGPVPVDATS
jgi:hypothetical protein